MKLPKKVPLSNQHVMLMNRGTKILYLAIFECKWLNVGGIFLRKKE
jgi:hypothetical protein